jgi:hypothetical protein
MIEIGRFIVLRPRLPDLEKGNPTASLIAPYSFPGGVG